MKKIVIISTLLFISGILATYIFLNKNTKELEQPDVITTNDSNNSCIPDTGC